MSNNSFFPTDIIIQILLLLRAKTLCKFRCVSKSWYTLISDPIFIESHHQRFKRNPCLLITPTNDNHKLHLSSLDTDGTLIRKHTIERGLWPFHISVVSPVFTCMDLVCMRDGYWSTFVFNPTTGEKINLPRNFTHSKLGAVGLGFGYIPSTNEYKVLRIFDEFGGCEVFTIGSRRWRRVQNSPFQTHGDGAFVNGAIHLLPVNNADEIARFDLEGEKWSTLTLPIKCPHSYKYSRELREMGGVLCLEIFSEDHGDFQQLSLYLLKDYDSVSWVYECSIDISHWIKSDVVPLLIEEDRRILVRSLDRLHYYYPKDRRFEEIEVEEEHFTASLYVESLRTLESHWNTRMKIKTWVSSLMKRNWLQL